MPPASPRDSQRSRVYRAETPLGGRRLPTLPDCEAYVEHVVGSLWWVARFPQRDLARIPRLRSLVLAIQSGPVDAARLAFTELTAQDHELAQHPVITRIGAALQSSQLREAWRIAQELRVPFPLAFATPGTAPTLSTPPRGFFAGFAAGHLDLSA